MSYRDPDMYTVLSFGAGVQSTAIVEMCIHGYLDKPDLIVFSDTGWEPPNVYEHLKYIERRITDSGMQFCVVSGGTIKDLRQATGMPVFLLGKDGSKGMSRRTCTSKLKIEPVEREVKRRVPAIKQWKPGQPPVVDMWIGISEDERHRAKVSPHGWKINSYPLLDAFSRPLTRDDCHDFFAKHGLPSAPRSACICCPYRTDAGWKEIAQRYPEEMEKVAELERRLQNAKVRDCVKTPRTRDPDEPHFRNTPFLHSSRVPIGEIDFTRDPNYGPGTLFPAEDAPLMWSDCGGTCGT